MMDDASLTRRIALSTSLRSLSSLDGGLTMAFLEWLTLNRAINTVVVPMKYLGSSLGLGACPLPPPPQKKIFEIRKLRNAISSDLRQNINTQEFIIFVRKKYSIACYKAQLMSQCDKISCI